MNLYPQDLRDVLHAVIVRRRAYAIHSGRASSAYTNLSAELPTPRLGRLGRFWVRGLRLTEWEAAVGLPAASALIESVQWFGLFIAAIPIPFSFIFLIGSSTLFHWEIFGGAVTFWSIVTSLSVTMSPCRIVRCLYRKPLSLGEIAALLPGARTEIDRAYVELMRDAISQAMTPDAQAGLREALRALGRAADSLPPAVSVPRDPETLRREAAAVRARALQEQDEVVAASGERQAEALERQAAALDRAAVVTRRGQVLHAEVLAQIEALHAGLTDFRADAATDTALLSILAEDARRVAQEASNVAQARAELDAFVAAPTRQSATPTEGALKAGQE